MIDIEAKYQTCNLCDALHRNINDNFISVSFEILANGYIQTKIVLKEMTEDEIEYIEDISTEFSSMQQQDCVLKPIVEIGGNVSPLKYVVYQKSR